jgi:NADPH2:quinone reductase
MLALAVTRGAPSKVQMRDVPEVVAAPDQVVIRVVASSINRGERSRLEEDAEEGHIFGWDIVGTVERSIGSAHPTPPGTRVVALASSGGGWAERVAVRASDVASIPEEGTVAQAVTLPVAGLTALRAIRVWPTLLSAKVLVIGGGAVAWYAVQFASMAGATVFAAVRTSKSVARLRSLGADQVFHGSAELPAGCDLVIDTVGGAETLRALASCRPFGRVVVIGNVGMPSAGLSTKALVASGCVVQGYRLVVEAESAPVGGDLRTLLDWVVSGRLSTPEVQEVDWRDSDRVGQAVRGLLGGPRPVLRIASK